MIYVYCTGMSNKFIRVRSVQPLLVKPGRHETFYLDFDCQAARFSTCQIVSSNELVGIGVAGGGQTLSDHVPLEQKGHRLASPNLVGCQQASHQPASTWIDHDTWTKASGFVRPSRSLSSSPLSFTSSTGVAGSAEHHVNETSCAGRSFRWSRFFLEIQYFVFR